MWIRVNIKSEIQIRIHSFWIRHTAYHMSFKEEIYFLGG